MHTTRIRFFTVGSFLLFAMLACMISSQGESSESEEALAKFQACSDDFANRGFAGIPYLDCLEPLSISELEAIREHDFCLANPDCLVAVQSALDTNRARVTQTEEGSCVGLTPEECANAGQHFYDEELTSAEPSECDTFEWPSRSAIQHISFENDRAILERWSNIEGYDGHERVATNTYQWIDPVMVRTIIFSADGYQQIDYQELNNCTWTYTFTLSE